MFDPQLAKESRVFFLSVSMIRRIHDAKSPPNDPFSPRHDAGSPRSDAISPRDDARFLRAVSGCRPFERTGAHSVGVARRAGLELPPHELF